MGVQLNKLAFNQPDYGEQALEIALDMVEKGINLVVIDSVSALTPRAEIEGTMENSSIGLQARMMGQALRKLTGVVSKKKAVVIFINQFRNKIGDMFSPITTSGGNALKFYASLRLEVLMRKAKATEIKGVTKLLGKEEETSLGNVQKIKTIKNKVFAPFKECEVSLYYGMGVDIVSDWYQVALNMGLISKGFVTEGNGKQSGYKLIDSKGQEHKFAGDTLETGLPLLMEIMHKAYK